MLRDRLAEAIEGETDMNLEKIIEAFGGVSQTARALGITRQTIYHWRRKGDIPEARRIQAEVMIKEINLAGVNHARR